jgi:hypothetical protein
MEEGSNDAFSLASKSVFNQVNRATPQGVARGYLHTTELKHDDLIAWTG